MVQCLLVEILCFLLAVAMLVVFTLGYGTLLVTGILRDTATPGLPPVSAPKKGESFPVTKLDASKGEVTPKIIQGFISRSEPVIIRNLPKETFSAFARGGHFAPPLKESMIKRGNVIMSTHYCPSASLGEFGEWIQKHVPQPAYHTTCCGCRVATQVQVPTSMASRTTFIISQRDKSACGSVLDSTIISWSSSPSPPLW